MDNAAVLSGGGHSVTVAEGKRLLSKSMSTHLPQGVTDRRYVEATLRDALYEKLTVGALRATGADRQYAQEGRPASVRVRQVMSRGRCLRARGPLCLLLQRPAEVVKTNETVMFRV